MCPGQYNYANIASSAFKNNHKLELFKDVIMVYGQLQP